MRRLRIIVLFILLSLLLPATSEGHGYIVRSIPTDRTVVTRSPNQIQIWFSEGLEREFSTIEVFDQTGQQIDLGDGGVDERNSAKLVVGLPSNLADGAYLVRLRPVFTSDGHAISDTMVFWVGEQVGGVKAESTSDRAVTLEVIWRIALTLTLTILAGTLWVYALILRPAWHNPKHRLGRLPPRVMNRLTGLLWGSLLIAFVTNILAILQISMTLFDASLGKVLQDNLWEIVLEGTNFGDVWQVRTLLLIAIILIQVVAAQQSRNRPGSTHILWLLNGFLVLGLLGTLSLISHAKGSSFWSTASILADYIHLTAVAFWIGSLIVVAVILRPALQPLTAIERGLALKVVFRRFSAIAVVCVSLIVVTGIYATSVNIYRPSNILGTTYGLTLLSKWILILPLLALGGLHHVITSPDRFRAFATRIKTLERFARLPQTIRIEVLFALIVMLAAGALPATPPPEPPNARGEVKVQTQTLPVEGYTVELGISPGAVGANAYDVRITQNEEPVAIDQVKIRVFNPAYGRYSLPLVLDQAEEDLWIGAAGDIDRAATWDVLIDFQPTADIPSLRAAFKWNFVTEVEDDFTRNPTPLNWLSAFLVIVVAGAWLSPVLYQSIAHMDWRPETAALAIGSTVIMIGLFVAGYFIFSSTSQRVQEGRDPPAEVQNPVFPDQESVTQGRGFYENECLTCHGERGLVPTSPEIDLLPTLLARRDDEFLNRILSRGIVGRHLYGTDLLEPERWSLINYLRSLE